MAGKKENLKALFTNTRTRVIIVFTVIIMLLVVIIGLIKFNSSINPDKSKTNLGNSPNISSIPGAVSQTAQYASLQETQNIEQAEKANKSGGSAIPTIIRTHKFGEGVEVVGPQQGTGGKGFETLAREDNSGTQQSLWLQSVKENSCSKASVANAINQGASLNEFKDACSCAQLKDNGYKLNELNKFCPCRELKAAGFNARELKEAGYTAEKLRQCGFDACELRGAEFTAQQMKDGGYSDGELKGSGFSDKDIARASGLPDGISSADVLNSGCKSDALGRLRTAGVTASAIRRISGCSAAQLKAAGFTVGDLKTAGFSAAELKNAGFSPANIKEAGYNARDLLNAGFTPDEVANAGFSADELKEAQEILPPGMTIDDIKAAGCDEQAIKRQRLAGVSAKLINKYSGCTAESLKNAGFSNNEIDGIKQMAAADQLGSSAESDKDAAVIKAAGCDVDSLKQLLIKGISAKRIHDLNGCSAEALKSAGFDARDLVNAGFTPAKLLAAGFTRNQINRVLPVDDATIKSAGCDPLELKKLNNLGVTAKKIHDLNGCNINALKQAGFNAKDIMESGFTPSQLLNAGFTQAEIDAAKPIDDKKIKDSGCDPQALKKLLSAGVSAKKIHDLNGCSAEALRNAGFDASDLTMAGFTPEQLQAAGFTKEQIESAKDASNANNAAIRAAGCDPIKLQALFKQGVSAKEIKELNGCSAEPLKLAGFDAKSLNAAGFSPSELESAGFTKADINAAVNANDAAIKAAGCDPQKLNVLNKQGFSAKRIRDLNGCSAEAFRKAGFDASELAKAGFTPEQLQAAGFTKEQIESAKDASNAAIRAAGCDPIKLQALFKQGVSAKEIKELNGCSADSLKLAGFDAKSLNAAGFSPSELESAGFTKADINAAVNANDAAIKAAGCDPQKLNVLNKQGFSAKRIRDLNGCSAEAFRKAGFDASELAKAGFTPEQLQAAGFGNVKLQSDNANISDKEIKDSGCDPIKLKKLFQSGVSAKRIHDLNGCSAEALKNAGFDAKQLANAGFTPSQLLAAGFTADQFKKAGLIPAVVIASGRTSDCNVDSLKSSHALGVSAETIKETLGCSAKQMKDAGYTATELKNAGFTAAELKDSGFSLDDLKNAGFNLKELQSAGFSANDLKNLGFTAAQLKEAGFSASDLKNAGLTLKQLKALGYNATNLKDAGFSAEEMRKEGFNAKELKEAGLNAGQLKNAGYSAQELLNAGFSPNDSSLAGLQEVTKTSTQPTSTVNFASKNGPSSIVAAAESNNKQLQEIVDRQQKQMTEQRHQQKIQQRANAMVSEASKDIQEWKAIPTQIYIAGSAPKENTTAAAGLGKGGINNTNNPQENLSNEKLKALIKAGDIIFAVLDTTVNTDEPSPILATVVDGPFKGAKLIGSFTLPSNADKMVISFNTMSVPGADKTTQINAYAIDANTARTAMSSRANHHYLSRYGALFAATFLEGFGNAFQSANTTISIGGSGGAAAGQNTTIANGVGRSTLENAVIGLATLGKSWGQVAQQNVNRPTTVEVFSGTGIGVLFTQDLKSL